MSSTAFGRTLRDGRLPLPRRLLRELQSWCEALEPEHPGPPWLYWHRCRCDDLFVLPLCLAGTKALLYASDYTALDSDVPKLASFADYVFLHDPRPFVPVVVFLTHVPPDFAHFEPEALLAASPRPPLRRTVLANKPFELSLTEVRSAPAGKAVMCAGPLGTPCMVPRDDSMTWMRGFGYHLTTESERVMYYPPYPDADTEGEFLNEGIAYWRFVDAVPVWLGASGWSGPPEASISVEAPYVALSSANSADQWREAWETLEDVRAGFRAAMASLARSWTSSATVDAGLQEWSRAALDAAPGLTSGVRAAPLDTCTVTVEVYQVCPQHAAWASPSSEFGQQVEEFASKSCPGEPKQGPFVSIVVHA